jgi:hypothetical protein
MPQVPRPDTDPPQGPPPGDLPPARRVVQGATVKYLDEAEVGDVVLMLEGELEGRLVTVVDRSITEYDKDGQEYLVCEVRPIDEPDVQWIATTIRVRF